jgi:adenylate cyclase
MSTVLHLTITGQESSQRLQNVLQEGESVRVGRSPQIGWVIPWDRMISREHADLTWNGKELLVACLESAQNPVIYRGRPAREARLGTDEWFQIGQTTFHASSVGKTGAGRGPADTAEFTIDSLKEEESFEEHAFSAEQLAKIAFRNADRQMEILARLPDVISMAHSDDELGHMLSAMLLEAIPKGLAVAVAHFDESELPATLENLHEFPKPLSMRVQTRDSFKGRFAPSRRMLYKCLKTRQSVMHILGEGETGSFTISDGLAWAMCTPLIGESSQGWCMYVSGKGSLGGALGMLEDDLAGDLRFAQLVGQFIGSIRQVRMLQEQKTQLSSFFSPKVIENLTNRNSSTVLAPAEKDISVLFCDVRGFSKKSEQLQGDLLTLLKSVSAALSVMASGIVERDGAIADFQGDAALGFWGWPTENPDGPVPACHSALAIYRTFRQSVAEAESLLFGFSIGMGVAHGRALAGQIGTNQQSKVGVFGPVVNQGSRLEGMTKQFGVPICIDDTTAHYVRRHFSPEDGRIRKLARVRPKGMDTPITVWSLLLPEHEFPEVSNETIACYEAALEKLTAGDWSEARVILEKIPDTDGPKQFLVRRMSELGSMPPPDWDGAFSLAEK